MRNLGPIFLILLALGLFGGFAWLTQHPETPILEQAEDWPLVGDLARRFRVAYLGRAAERGAETEAGTEPPASEAGDSRTVSTAPRARRLSPDTVRIAGSPESRAGAGGAAPEALPAVEARPEEDAPETGDDVAAGSEGVPGLAQVESVIAAVEQAPAVEPSGPPEVRPIDLPYQVDEWIWCLPGNRILAESEPASQVQERLSSMAYLPVLGRRGEWAQVTFRGRRGWIDTSWRPSFRRRGAGRGILRHRYEPVKASDSRRLKRAREVLGIERPSRKLGAYTLYTDVEDEELLAFLDLAAATAEDAYFARYGRLPSGNPKRSAVLFSRRADYRRYAEIATGLPGTEAGHAGRGVLAMFAEGRSRQSLARTLVHEIGHLLNDRAVALHLPTWLEEGMASDLGSLWVEGSPNESGPLTGLLGLVTNGPEARLLRLAATLEAGRLPPVAVVMNLDRETFRANPAWAYAHGAALVRFLLDSEAGRRGEAFRTFLKRVAAGHGADPALLLRLLEMDAGELDAGFRAWLRAEAAAAEGRLPATGS